jgi:hypothetical protein
MCLTHFEARGETAPAALKAAPRLGWLELRSTIARSLRVSRTGVAETEARRTARIAKVNFIMIRWRGMWAVEG